MNEFLLQRFQHILYSVKNGDTNFQIIRTSMSPQRGGHARDPGGKDPDPVPLLIVNLNLCANEF